jgi:hypothetical protein
MSKVTGGSKRKATSRKSKRAGRTKKNAVVDDETRRVALESRLASLEQDNYGNQDNVDRRDANYVEGEDDEKGMLSYSLM